MPRSHARTLVHSHAPALRFLVALFSVAVFALALSLLHRELRHWTWHDVLRALEAIPSSRLLLAAALTALGYLALIGYDTLALRHIGHPLSRGRTSIASFIGSAVGNNLGYSVITGGSLRYRFYSGWGLSAVEVTQVVAFCALTTQLGVLTLAGVAMVLKPVELPASLHLPVSSLRPLGILFLAITVSYLILCAALRRPWRIFAWEFTLPRPRIALAQVAVGCVDFALAAAALWMLLPETNALTYPHLLGIYLVVILASLISNVPGGLGVFESLIVIILAPILPAPAVLGSLVAYRVVYFLLPLACATVLLAGHELLERREHVRWIAGALSQSARIAIPHLLALSTFVGGAVLLFSGATPSEGSRLAWLGDFLPLPVMQISHFLGSLAGAALLVLAWGLNRRLDAAHRLAMILLALGIVVSLLKGFDYEEAIILSVMLLFLAPSHRHFYRKASLLSGRLTPGWIAAIGLVLISSLWLLLFAYRHVEYTSDLWWRFTLHGDAPRSLRATVGAIAALFLFGASRLMRPGPSPPTVPAEADLDRAAEIITRARTASANLALLGDKELLFSESGSAFLMYGVEGRSWVALGDPVGEESEMPELAWSFRELSDRFGGWTVFYQVPPQTLPLYLDLGLTLLKLGEEGRVPLERFSADGKAPKKIRYDARKAEREGCCFEVLPRDELPAVLPELREVSDAWLVEKRAREKGFSLGFFDERYLRHFPTAVVRREGRIIAFANILPSADQEELMADLIRYRPGSPHGLMDFLFAELLLWGNRQGYRWFNIGMAPLAGLEMRALAPAWNRLAGLLYRHGELFYNFQGLRAYKEKFDPVWEPRYLACPGGLALPRVLANMTSLIAGGLRGVIAK
jgi:phosphatidylglycerol lysyltransferase